MNIFRYIPYMGFLLVFYNILSSRSKFSWNHDWIIFHLPSDSTVTLSYSEGIIAVGLLVLFIEIVKATTVTNFAIFEQVLSVLVFVAFLMQFLNSGRTAEPTLLILTLMSLIEVLAGFVILTKVAMRDISFGG